MNEKELRPKRPLRLRAIGVVAVLAAAASLVFVSPASAQDDDLPPGVEIVRVRPNGKTVFRAAQGRFYDNGFPPDGGDETPHLVLAGFDMYDVCFESPSVPRKAMAFQQANGTWRINSLRAGIDVRTAVYETDLDVFAFFDATCEAFFENGTPIPAPFATGITTMRLNERGIRDLINYFDESTPQPRGRYTNGVEGQVADRDGNVFDVKTVADFAVRSNGEPDFFELSATLTPSAA